ncbi:MAG: PilN domain-containing protein [Candidatus Omnitrophota bacterium]
MPQINLLAPGFKKREVTPSTASFSKAQAQSQFQQKTERVYPGISSGVLDVLPAVGFRCAICGGIILAIWSFFLVNIPGNQKTLKELEVKVSVLATNPKEIERIRTERVILEKKVNLIDNLSSRKFLWSEKLALIADLIPDGVWINEIRSSSKKDAAAAKAPPSDEKTVFTIKGTAVAYKIQDAVGLISDFIKNLQENADFSKDFQEIKLNTIAKGTVGSLDVMKFDLLCESK